MTAAVRFDAVDVIFGTRPAPALALLDQGADRDRILADTGCVLGVADATLDVAAGSVCVLMGLSGSGKSTLLRCVNGLNRPVRGRVVVTAGGDTVDLSRCGARALRRLRSRRVSMVFQQFALLPWRSVADNVGFGLELRGSGRAERARVVDEKLELVGLSSWRDKPVGALSGGMQQRVGLARAFATDADILLMDEPFSALDPLIRGRLQDELLALQQSLKKTIVFVSHDLDEALKIGSSIAIMEGGRIVQVGAPERIVLEPANAYVADFVAHMNPLNVLRGGSVMTPLEALPREGAVLHYDALQIELDAAGAVAAVAAPGGALNLADYDAAVAPGQALSGGYADSALRVPVDIDLRAVLALREAGGRPLLLHDDGRLVGVIGDREIYRSLLREPRAVTPTAGVAPKP